MPRRRILITLSAAGLFAVGTAVSCHSTDARDRAPVIETIALVKDSATALVGWRTFEQPTYETVLTDGRFQIRTYGGMTIARATDPEDEGKAFGRLFRYLSGANVREAKVAMTAPALMHDVEDGRAMVFVLPSRYTAESAPAPSDQGIAMETLASTTYATVRFSGLLSDERVAEKTEALLEWMERTGVTRLGDPLVAGYDPPFTLPALRRNEVWIPIAAPEMEAEPGSGVSAEIAAPF